ncbi:hypothetical protein [Nocardia sp. BMG51109]|uniref:immunity protein Imm33 domain-containing protein n=1 Tax=Nocardia sp. BMG51109 TaxID=1056816 RepID=UPI0004662DC2|nr:hypothetical protein [Nocardia sp. BMG51109]
MRIFRTTACAAAGHPEFTLVFRGAPATPHAAAWIVGQLENAVAQGARFAAGEEFRVGWRRMRVVEHDDRTLGLTERVGDDTWEEQVDRTLGDMWLQVKAAAELELPEVQDALDEEEIAIVQPCAFDAGVIVLNRMGPDSHQPGQWGVSCGDEHDHAAWDFMKLFRLTAALPFLAQFLALPPETGLIIARDTVDADGGVVAEVAYRNTMITADGGARFGPDPAPGEPEYLRPHFSIERFGEGLYRTTIGRRQGHPDVVARIADPPVPGLDESLVEWVLDDVQDAMAVGTRFASGRTIRIGWRTLRLTERDDGMLGLLERTGEDAWAEHVEQTLGETWYQKEVAASLGLVEELAFPRDDQYVTIAECVQPDLSALLLCRTEAGDPDDSGWMVCCLNSHDHGPWRRRTTWEVSRSMPFATQFLALPPGISVAIDAPGSTATGRIGVRVLFGDRRMLAHPDSYLARLGAG